jgi:mannose-6-phosphate isomerase-like protein (cupin superfamily)
MTDGLLLGPGAGLGIAGAGMTLKVGDEHSRAWSAFETVVSPGFDVGAHLHTAAEEFFYILDGELDMLAFHPRTEVTEATETAGAAQPAGAWREWESASGMRVMRGGPGAAMFVPAGCPHAFANPADSPARMLFLVSPPGHEHYLAEMGELIGRGGPPSPSDIAELRARWDIKQLTPMVTGRPATGRPAT